MGVMQGVEQMVAQFIGSEVAGARFIRDVRALRDGPEGERARAARVRAASAWSLDQDPELRLAERARAEIAAALDAVEKRLDALAVPAGALDVGPAAEIVAECRGALAEVARWIAAAKQGARAWIHERRRAGLRALDEKLLVAVEHATDLARERARYSEETTRLAGRRDEADLGHPFPALLGQGDMVERIKRRLEG
ncbi:MAG: hypothetical protein HY726_08995 [Candidatus Rokubacteria bacterium]|nr:hypothetical protein [Candidatus Rokubacteria bacterium]